MFCMKVYRMTKRIWYLKEAPHTNCFLSDIFQMPT